MIDDKVIEEIVNACKRDQRLFFIVKDISKLENKERLKLRKKASLVLSKDNPVEKEAIIFYFVITEPNIAEEVLRRLEK